MVHYDSLSSPAGLVYCLTSAYSCLSSHSSNRRIISALPARSTVCCLGRTCKLKRKVAFGGQMECSKGNINACWIMCWQVMNSPALNIWRRMWCSFSLSRSVSVFQERSRWSLAGLLPHAAECAGLQLSAVSAQSSPATRRSPAGELQQQTAQSEEPAGGADPGGSLLTQMSLLLDTLVRRLRSNIFKHCCCIQNDFLQTALFFHC